MFYSCVLLGSLLAAAPDSAAPTVDNVKCGGHSLYIALRALDYDLGDYAAFERELGPPASAGYSMLQLAEYAQKKGAHALGVQTSLDNLRLRTARFSCIALMRAAHFVVVIDVDDKYVHYVDSGEVRSLPRETFAALWDGKALLVAKSPLVSEEDLPRPFAWRTWGVVGAAAVAIICLFALWRSRAVAKPALLLLLPLAGLLACGSPAGPALVAVSPYQDLGEVEKPASGRLRVPFKLLNAGTRRVTVDRISTSCTCADATISHKRIDPGHEATVDVSISRFDVLERQNAFVTIHSDDLAAMTLPLEIAWTPVSDLSIMPPALDFASLTLGESPEAKVIAVRPRHAEWLDKLEVTAIPPGSLDFDIQRAGNEATISVRPSAMKTALETIVGRTLRLSYPNGHVLVPVTWTLRERIAAIPTSISLTAGAEGDSRSAVCVVRALPGDVLEIETIAIEGLSAPPEIRRQTMEAHQERIDISLALPAARDVGSLLLVIHVRKPQAVVLRVPLRWLVK